MRKFDLRNIVLWSIGFIANRCCIPPTKLACVRYWLRVLLLVADCANHAEFAFLWPAWAVYQFAPAAKGSRQNHMAISHCC